MQQPTAKPPDLRNIDGDHDSRSGNELDAIARALCHGGSNLPGRLPVQKKFTSLRHETLVDIIESLRSALFPGFFSAGDLADESRQLPVAVELDRVLRSFPQQIKNAFSMTPAFRDRDEKDALTITQRLLALLPQIQSLLVKDIQAALDGDPAATCPEEVILCYPGLFAVTYYRIAHQLHLEGVPLIPRIITEHAHSMTGIDIHPGAEIGEYFFIDHGTGVVIGETTVIGSRVYQGVTLGARSLHGATSESPMRGIPRHPIVEDYVIIYAGATILGRVTIGRGSIIGGGVWLTESVPPGSVVTQAKGQRENCLRPATK